jgi:AcrR family transcriptional regulator
LRRLPPGPHGLPPELVERNQRERLIAAMAEVCAERGYVESSIAEVAKRAGVSTASFYRQFKDKRECMLASFEELFERLLEALVDACAGKVEPGEKARVGAGAAAALLSEDPPTARLLSIEIAAIGPAGVKAQHEAIDRLTALLGDRGSDSSSLPSSAWIVVAACVASIGRRSAEEAPLAASELEAIAAQL